MFDFILIVTRNVTVTGSWDEVGETGNTVIRLARDLNMDIVCDDTFDDASPYAPVEHDEHDEHTVWSREVRVRGSRRAMRTLRAAVAASVSDAVLTPA